MDLWSESVTFIFFQLGSRFVVILLDYLHQSSIFVFFISNLCSCCSLMWHLLVKMVWIAYRFLKGASFYLLSVRVLSPKSTIIICNFFVLNLKLIELVYVSIWDFLFYLLFLCSQYVDRWCRLGPSCSTKWWWRLGLLVE